MLGSLVQTAAPAADVVSADGLKRYLHGVADDEADADLEALVAAATEYVEGWLDEQLITATWALTLPGFPCGLLELKPPLQSVTSIVYYDYQNVQQTWSSAEYEVDTKHRPGRVRPAYGFAWPSTYVRLDAVTVTFKAGYGAAATDVPATLVLAINALCAHWYEFRGEVITGTIVAAIPGSVDRLLGINSHGAYF